jgi:hypothetical protein
MKTTTTTTMPSRPQTSARAHAALATLTALTAMSGCGLYEPLPGYEGLSVGQACGPCGRGVFDGEVCGLGELDGLIDPGAACERVVHVDASTPAAPGDQDGSPQAPYASLSAGLSAAGGAGAAVVLLAGDGPLYHEPGLTVGSGVHVLGGYAAGDFATDPMLRPVVTVTGPQGADQVVGLTARKVASYTQIARLDVVTAGRARTHIGALLEDSPLLELVDVGVVAGPGARGADGAPGVDGVPGGDGGSAGFSWDIGVGGVNTACGRAEREGGDGGVGAVRTSDGLAPARGGQDAPSGARGGDQGNYGVPGAKGQDGAPGRAGDPGAPGALGAFEVTRWVVAPGAAGAPGGHGGGGAGGGGGSDQNMIPHGGAGGGGGAGGCGGTGGGPGGPGGSSFGALILKAPPVFTGDVRVVASRGGDGGLGGVGGLGGMGGMGGVGGAQDDPSAGGAGGQGGQGGDGGRGAPGVPGHSVAVVCLGAPGGAGLWGLVAEHSDPGSWGVAPGDPAPQTSPMAQATLGCDP